MYSNTPGSNTAENIAADIPQPVQLPQPPAPVVPAPIISGANSSTNSNAPAGQAEFMQEIKQQPIPASPTPGAAGTDVPPPDSGSSSPQPAKDWKDFLGLPAKPAPQPEPEQKKPDWTFTDEPQAEEIKQPIDISGIEDNYLFIEETKNTAIATLLAWWTKTKADNWLISEEGVKRMAKAAAKMKIKWIEEMDGNTQYIAINAMTYAPLLHKAYEISQMNIRNAKVTAQAPAPAYSSNNMHRAASNTVPFPSTAQPQAATGKGERTRYEINSQGYYNYSRRYPNQAPAFVPAGSIDAEKVDLTDIDALKRIIMKNGGWKATARKLNISHEWMAEKGLDKNNFDIAE